MGNSCLVTVTFSLVSLLTTLNVLLVNFSSNVNWCPCTVSNDECNAKCLCACSSRHAIPLHSDHMPQGNQKNIFPWRGGKIGGWAVIVHYNELMKHDNVSFCHSCHGGHAARVPTILDVSLKPEFLGTQRC